MLVKCPDNVVHHPSDVNCMPTANKSNCHPTQPDSDQSAIEPVKHSTSAKYFWSAIFEIMPHALALRLPHCRCRCLCICHCLCHCHCHWDYVTVRRSCFVPHILYSGIYLSIYSYLSTPCLVAAVSALFCSSSSLSLTVSSSYNGKQPATRCQTQ